MKDMKLEVFSELNSYKIHKKRRCWLKALALHPKEWLRDIFNNNIADFIEFINSQNFGSYVYFHMLLYKSKLLLYGNSIIGCVNIATQSIILPIFALLFIGDMI